MGVRARLECCTRAPPVNFILPPIQLIENQQAFEVPYKEDGQQQDGLMYSIVLK